MLFLVALFGTLFLVFNYAAAASTTQFCYTKSDTSPVESLPTSTSNAVVTFTRQQTITTTPSTTVTPDPITRTTKILSTTFVTVTASQHIDTTYQTISLSTSTTLQLPVSTIYTSITITVDDSQTIAGSTTTIPTAPGFSPVIDTLPGAQYPRRKRSHIERLHPIIAGAGTTTLYPVSVICYNLREIYQTDQTVLTASVTATVTARRPTSTSTYSTVLTKTSIYHPTDASVTSTVSTTASITIEIQSSTTVTSTFTSTNSILLASSTIYAACQQTDTSSINSIGNLNGYSIITFDAVGLGVGTNDTTTMGCCTSCLANPDCAFVYFNPAGGGPGEYCGIRLVPPEYCTRQDEWSAVAYYYNSNNLGPDQGYYVGNGNCGFFTQADAYN